MTFLYIIGAIYIIAFIWMVIEYFRAPLMPDDWDIDISPDDEEDVP